MGDHPRTRKRFFGRGRRVLPRRREFGRGASGTNSNARQTAKTRTKTQAKSANISEVKMTNKAGEKMRQKEMTKKEVNKTKHVVTCIFDGKKTKCEVIENLGFQNGKYVKAVKHDGNERIVVKHGFVYVPSKPLFLPRLKIQTQNKRQIK